MAAKSEPNIVLSNQEFNVVGTRPNQGRHRSQSFALSPGAIGFS